MRLRLSVTQLDLERPCIHSFVHVRWGGTGPASSRRVLPGVEFLKRHRPAQKTTGDKATLMVYADNGNHLPLSSQAADASLETSSRHLDEVGPLTHEKESATIVTKTLGVRVDGIGGSIAPTPERGARPDQTLTALGEGEPINYEGRVRRSSLSKGIIRPVPLWDSVREEVQMIRGLLVLASSDLRAETSPTVLVSDACLSGYGLARERGRPGYGVGRAMALPGEHTGQRTPWAGAGGYNEIRRMGGNCGSATRPLTVKVKWCRRRRRRRRPGLPRRSRQALAGGSMARPLCRTAEARRGGAFLRSAWGPVSGEAPLAGREVTRQEDAAPRGQSGSDVSPGKGPLRFIAAADDFDENCGGAVSGTDSALDAGCRPS